MYWLVSSRVFWSTSRGGCVTHDLGKNIGVSVFGRLLLAGGEITCIKCQSGLLDMRLPYPDIPFTHHPRHLRVGVGGAVQMVNLLKVGVRDVLRIQPT